MGVTKKGRKAPRFVAALCETASDLEPVQSRPRKPRRPPGTVIQMGPREVLVEEPELPLTGKGGAMVLLGRPRRLKPPRNTRPPPAIPKRPSARARKS